MDSLIGRKVRGGVLLAALTAATAFGQELPCESDCGDLPCQNYAEGTTTRVVSQTFHSPGKFWTCKELGNKIRVICEAPGVYSNVLVTYWTGEITCTVTNM